MRRPSCQIQATSVRAVALALALTLGTTGACAQSPIIAVGPPSFQSEDFPSLQSDILDRIAATGQLQPNDLPNLTRLMTLESVAMLADIHADMPVHVNGKSIGGTNQAALGFDRTHVRKRGRRAARFRSSESRSREIY